MVVYVAIYNILLVDNWYFFLRIYYLLHANIYDRIYHICCMIGHMISALSIIICNIYIRLVHYANLDRYCINLVHALKHLLPAECVLNVLFLVADFQPSRCVETYSRAVFTLLIITASIW